ncbi:MAG: hypothetical protein WA913_12210 [Pricia sp.]
MAKKIIRRLIMNEGKGPYEQLTALISSLVFFFLAILMVVMYVLMAP